MKIACGKCFGRHFGGGLLHKQTDSTALTALHECQHRRHVSLMVVGIGHRRRQTIRVRACPPVRSHRLSISSRLERQGTFAENQSLRHVHVKSSSTRPRTRTPTWQGGRRRRPLSLVYKLTNYLTTNVRTNLLGKEVVDVVLCPLLTYYLLTCYLTN